MRPWKPLPGGVSWTSHVLLSFRASRARVEDCLGPPHDVAIDSNGLGPYDAWALAFPCGLEMTILLFHYASRVRLVEDRHEPAIVEVLANRAHEKHILFHLPLSPIELLPFLHSPFVAEPTLWRVLRQDDHGTTFEVGRYASECEASSVVADFESRHHKQIYWTEPIDVRDSRGSP